jgi:hypothetical protein
MWNGLLSSAAAPTPRPVGAVSPAPSVAPSPAATVAPTTPVSPQPMASQSELMDRVSGAWAADDWPAAVSALEALRTVSPTALDFKDKLYAAHFSWARSLQEAGDIDGAIAQAREAQRIDLERGEAPALIEELSGSDS